MSVVIAMNLFSPLGLVPSSSISTPSYSGWRYVGSIEPLKNFDPLNVVENAPDNRLKFIREAELMHGRTAMLATVGIPFLEVLDQTDSTLGINYLSSLDFNHQVPFWFTLLNYETLRMGVGWVNPFTDDGIDPNKTFTLEKNYQPGNLGKYNMTSISNDLLNKELSNGRLAMIAFVGIVAQELAQGKQLF
tara:strand:+ start:49 stop:618 length:570 start_codon:yes stop_codon:yes gene_type:complete